MRNRIGKENLRYQVGITLLGSSAIKRLRKKKWSRKGILGLSNVVFMKSADISALLYHDSEKKEYKKCRERRPKHRSGILKKVRWGGFSIKYRGSSERFMSNHPDLFKYPKLKEIVHLKCLIQCWQILNCQTHAHTHTQTSYYHSSFFFWVISQFTLLPAYK